MHLTEERAALRDAVRGLLARYQSQVAADSPSGWDRSLWRRMCAEIGVAGLAVPERYGGSGATVRETQVVLEELGRTLTLSPMLGSAVLATHALLAAGDDAACRRLLPGLCAGDRIAALAWVDRTGRWDPDRVACTADQAGALTGAAHHVLDADAADILLVAARGPDGVGLYQVEAGAAGVIRAPTDGLDLARRLATVRLDGAPGRRIGTGNPLPAVRDVACAALAAEQVGAASRALELTVEYTRTRVQFGRPIGAFQALQHRLADLHVLVQAARSAAEAAGSALAADVPPAEGTPDASAPAGGTADASALAAVAKVYCSEALQAVAGEMIQMHGGIAITWEHDAHRYLRRAYASAQLIGSPREHVTRLAGALL